MCGIVGIVKLNQRDTVDEARLKRMRDVLRHRGPDGEGLWIEGPVGLGMRRLAIVDVLGGRQPMANEDGTVWIVYNGEVYNHADLRPGLEQRGHCYRTRSDTETILHLYEEEGERCVERLQGMFAFALWDRRRGRLLRTRGACPARECRPEPPDERRAARAVPVRWDGFERAGSPDGADGQGADPHLRGRLFRPRGQRARLCASGRALGRGGAPGAGDRPRRIFRRAAPARLA